MEELTSSIKKSRFLADSEVSSESSVDVFQDQNLSCSGTSVQVGFSFFEFFDVSVSNTGRVRLVSDNYFDVWRFRGTAHRTPKGFVQKDISLNLVRSAVEQLIKACKERSSDRCFVIFYRPTQRSYFAIQTSESDFFECLKLSDSDLLEYFSECLRSRGGGL